VSCLLLTQSGHENLYRNVTIDSYRNEDGSWKHTPKVCADGPRDTPVIPSSESRPGQHTSNLRMAESKSNCFAFGIKARSEKSLKIESISIN
jgi:hypothetical protein